MNRTKQLRTTAIDSVWFRLLLAVVGIFFISFVLNSWRLRSMFDRLNLPAADSLQFSGPRPPTPSQPRCNFHTFRDVSSRTPGGYISGSGTWKRRNGTNVLERFSPRFCRLRYGKWIPPGPLAACLKRDNVRYIAIIGDSNGRGYFHALHRLLNATVRPGVQGQCTPRQRIHALTYDSYTSPDVLVKHRCPCGGFCTLEYSPDMRNVHCYVMQARCDINIGPDNNTLSVYIEYIASWWTLDYRIQYTANTGCQKTNASKVEVRSNTTQSFLLGEYFSDPKPDILLVFSNTHDNVKLSEHTTNVDAFSKLIDQFIGQSTRLVWATRHAEDASKKPEPYRSQRFQETVGNVTRSLTRIEWLDAANRILYDKMKEKFIGVGRPLLFPDLLEMSKPVLSELNVDGVHMEPDWYQFVMAFLLQSLCDISCDPHKGECPVGDMKHWEEMTKTGTLV